VHFTQKALTPSKKERCVIHSHVKAYRFAAAHCFVVDKYNLLQRTNTHHAVIHHDFSLSVLSIGHIAAQAAVHGVAAAAISPVVCQQRSH
jgi:hypothetical protein